jgi:hypothetical protein
MYLFTKPISSEIEISPDLNGLQPLLQKLDRFKKLFLFAKQKKKQKKI